VAHANARLTPAGRLILCQRIAAGRPAAHVAAEMGVSRTCAYRWWARYRQAGQAGLVDRPSTARSHPHRVPASVEAEIVRLRRQRKLGPARIAPLVGRPASTVHRVLCRHGLNRLAWMDRPTGRVVRRYERAAPGELVHLDVKKLGRIPDGGGHRAHGRGTTTPRARGIGHDYVHSAVDDHSRLAYSEVLADEQTFTCVGFLHRALAFFTRHGVTVQRVLTDNAPGYTSGMLTAALAAGGAAHKRTRPYRPGDQRQGRTVQPHPAGRVGLRPGLHQQPAAHRRAGRLAAPVQPSPCPHRTRRPPTDQPRQQRSWLLQLERGAFALRRIWWPRS
jgi:transposase-like protein